MTLDAHRLLVLRAVHRTGSVAAAAAALHLTASGVSQHLARLETEARLPLLDRSRRGGGRSIALTAAGIALAQCADEVALALAEADREADRRRNGTTGHVRVGGFATALGALVVPILNQLAISDPALQVQVFEVDAADGSAMLRAGELDLLLGERYSDPTSTAPQPYPGMIEHDLRLDPFQIVVPTLWPAPVSLEQLLTGPWVSATSHQPARNMLDQLCARHGVTGGRRHPCRESPTILALVAAGLGAAILPELALSFLSTDGVTVYAPTVEIGARVLTLTGPRSRDRSPSTQRVHQLLQATATRSPHPRSSDD